MDQNRITSKQLHVISFSEEEIELTDLQFITVNMWLHYFLSVPNPRSLLIADPWTGIKSLMIAVSDDGNECRFLTPSLVKKDLSIVSSRAGVGVDKLVKNMQDYAQAFLGSRFPMPFILNTDRTSNAYKEFSFYEKKSKHGDYWVMDNPTSPTKEWPVALYVPANPEEYCRGTERMVLAETPDGVTYTYSGGCWVK